MVNSLLDRFYKFVDSIKVLPNTQFDFRKGLGTTDTLFLLTHDLQSSLDKQAKLRIVSLDFSSAFDLVKIYLIINMFWLMETSANLNLWFLEFLKVVF